LILITARTKFNFWKSSFLCSTSPNRRQQRRMPVWPATHTVWDGDCCCANIYTV